MLLFLLKNKSFIFRYDIIVPRFGYFVPQPKNLFSFVDHLKQSEILNIISVGAGYGFFEMLLHNLTDINIKVSDIVPPDIRHFPMKNYTALEHIKKNENEDVCFMFVWPPVEDWVYESIKYLRQKNKSVIMAGGLYDGCCWNDTLDDEFTENWTLVYDDWFYTYQGIDVEYFKIFKPL